MHIKLRAEPISSVKSVNPFTAQPEAVIMRVKDISRSDFMETPESEGGRISIQHGTVIIDLEILK